MANRREFLQAGIAASVLPMAASAGEAAPLAPPRALTFYKVVFDERFPASVAFAREMERLGAPIHGITGDMTDLWFHDLFHRWSKGPAAIAGMTAHGPLFCLERLAWDQGMRVVYRADHNWLAEGSLEHALRGPAEMLRRAKEIDSLGADWGGWAANVLATYSEGDAGSFHSAIASTVVQPEADEPLISWIIAPKPKVVRS
jgi:hypothetical protein